LLSSCGAKSSHRDFRLALVRNMVDHAGRNPCHPQPPALSSTRGRLESANNDHWPSTSTARLKCHVCSSRGKRKDVRTRCKKCNVGLCILGCFEDYHTKVRFS
jgi:hypothetical protein